MRLVSFTAAAGDRLGVEAGPGHIWSASSLGSGLPGSMAELLAGGQAALAALRSATARASAEGRSGDVDPASRIAPVPRPGKVVAIGLNYRDHAAELGLDIPDVPLMFAKFPTSVVGDGATVSWDPALTNEVDLEVELAVVIGRAAREVGREAALEHVLGYTCLNDVTARDLQFSDGQYVRSKSLDTFCPMGPVVVTSDELPDPGDLAVRSWRNGELMQDSRTSELIFDVAELVAFCSRAFTLEPGDVIATGTPGGIGYFREPRISMRDGDLMRIEVEGIGSLTNPCRERPAGGSA
jgi:2-keto-4-pentenoate hydratase/2-oxohepta-3-ene-1,7-dioic acid hydratase in catechol pathway